jgi:hypothetical protein
VGISQDHLPVGEDRPAAPNEARNERRRRRELIWVLSVVAYTVIRFVIAWEAFSDYGVNVWIFGALDIGTAIPYAIGTARVVIDMVDKRYKQAALWMVVAAVSFLAPYIYLVIAGKDKSLPTAVYVVVGLLVVGLGANAILAIRKKIRLAKEAKLAAAAPAG